MDEMDQALENGRQLTQRSSDALAGRPEMTIEVRRTRPDGQPTVVKYSAYEDDGVAVEAMRGYVNRLIDATIATSE